MMTLLIIRSRPSLASGIGGKQGGSGSESESGGGFKRANRGANNIAPTTCLAPTPTPTNTNLGGLGMPTVPVSWVAIVFMLIYSLFILV